MKAEESAAMKNLVQAFTEARVLHEELARAFEDLALVARVTLRELEAAFNPPSARAVFLADCRGVFALAVWPLLELLDLITPRVEATDGG